jgi:hypothetical protein
MVICGCVENATPAEVPTDDLDTARIEAGPAFELLVVDLGGTYAAVVTGIEESETSDVPSTVVAVTERT